jgi:hypothetical protein
VSEKKSSRILTFDLLRGYFLVAIILDHLDFFPNGLDWWSAQGSLFVTTAEGFFLISGLVLGIVRGSKLINEPFKNVAKLLLKRSLQLYVTTIILVLIFTLLGWWFFMDNPGLKVGILPPDGNVFEFIWNLVTLQYFYGWADYLRLYAIFMFVSPLAMWLLRKGKWYILLTGSIAIWLLFPSGPDVPDLTQELMQPLSWQLVFFSGMIIGFHWQQLTTWWNTLTKRTKQISISSLLSVSFIALVVNAWIVFILPHFNIQEPNFFANIDYRLYIEFFDKERLPFARLVLFALWFWSAFYLFRKFEPFIIRTVGWLLIPFGTNSLYVYTLHAFVIFFVHLWLQKAGLLFNLVVSLVIIALIRIAIHYRFLMKIIPR